jgi:branched-chain amino acid transport system substrate-binding protein
MRLWARSKYKLNKRWIRIIRKVFLKTSVGAKGANLLSYSSRFLMKMIAYSIALLFIFSGVSPCTLAAESPIKIGVLLPLTGSQARFGQIEKKSYLMAAEEINAAGGVNGKKIELVIADTQGNPDAGRAAIGQLIRRDQVLVIGGGFSSSATWATISIAQQNKIPFLVNSAAADKITEQNWEYIFRLNQPVGEHFETFAAFVKEAATGIRSVALVYDNTLRGASEARRFFKTAQGLNLRLIARERYDTGTGNFKPLLGKVKTQGADLVYMVADDVRDAVGLIRQSRELKLNPKLFVGAASGFTQLELAKNAEKAFEHVVSLVPWCPSAPYPGARKYFEKYKATNNIAPGYHGAEAYAGMQVIAAALKRASAPSPGGIRAALAAMDLITVFGPVKFISYDRKSRQNKLPTLLVQWIDGKLEVIWPKHLATKKTIYPAPE